MATAVIENVNKMSKYGLRRRPTYEEITNLISENEKLTGTLPNRDATFFRNSPEGSIFDGADAMEQLREEQGKLLLRQMSELLLRQNVRTAGRTYHAEKSIKLPTTSPVISQPTQPMNVDEETSQQTTPTMPSSSTQQASQLQAELTQRGDKAMKRKEETAVNHRGEVFKQNKPTITEQIHHINPPRSFTPIQPQMFNIATDNEMSQQTINEVSLNKPKPKRKARASASSSSLDSIQIPIVDVMDVSSSSKRATPEIEGKAGRRSPEARETSRPNMKKQHFDTSRPDADKRDATTSPEDEPKTRKRRNKKRDLALGGAEADDEDEEPRGKKGVRKTIQKPLTPTKIGIQRLREEFENAKNKDMISKENYNLFDISYKAYLRARKEKNDKDKARALKEKKAMYEKHLFDKLKESYKAQ